jgi:two-component system chemotaxis response regulator CheB
MFASGHSDRGFGVVVIAASHGGFEALSTVMAGLPASFAVPVVVLLHRRARAQDRLATVLGRRCALPVTAARHGESLAAGRVLVAPPEGLVFDGQGRVVVPTQGGARRSGDALFTSAARAYGPGVISVVLSGCLDDGAHGVGAVKSGGGRVLIQRPDTAGAASMPQAALATGCADFVLPPALLSSALVALAMARGGDELLRVTPPPWAALHPWGASPLPAG